MVRAIHGVEFSGSHDTIVVTIRIFVLRRLATHQASMRVL